MHTTRILDGALALGAAFGLAACGELNEFPFGTGGAGGPTLPVTTVLRSDPAIDGVVFSTGAAVSMGGRPRLGDLDGTLNGTGQRQFFSFDLSTLGGSTTLTSASLRLWQVSVQGTPYTTHGGVLLEVVDIGSWLDGADFALPALGSLGAPLNFDATLGAKEVDVTALVRTALQQGSSRWQIRLRFAALDSDGDGVSDNAEFSDAEGSAPGSTPPGLSIRSTGP